MSLWTPYENEVLDLSKTALLTPSPRRLDSPASLSLSPFCHEYSCFTSPSPPQRVPEDYVLSPEGSPTFNQEKPVKGATRPFKVVSVGLPEQSVVDTDPGYAAFRAVMLDAMRAKNGGSLCVSNPRMRRWVRRSAATKEDEHYVERRAKNNAAAKRSRDLRKQKEDELAIRAAYLEQQNAQLRAALTTGVPAVCCQCRRTLHL